MIYILIVLAVFVGFLLGIGFVRLVDRKSTAYGAIDFVDIGEPNVLYVSSEESKKLGTASYLKLRIVHIENPQN